MVDVVDENVPLLILLKDLEENNLLLKYIDNRLEFVSQGTSVPV